jgi:hypothetical protein
MIWTYMLYAAPRKHLEFDLYTAPPLLALGSLDFLARLARSATTEGRHGHGRGLCGCSRKPLVCGLVKFVEFTSPVHDMEHPGHRFVAALDYLNLLLGLNPKFPLQNQFPIMDLSTYTRKCLSSKRKMTCMELLTVCIETS